MRAFRLAYDGAPFSGFQRQPDVPTVEDALFSALVRLGVHDPDESKPLGYAAAGRTDAGVSALAQTVAFECPDWCRPSALNGELPDAICAWAWAEVPEDFHATLDARRRAYVYHLHAPETVDARLHEAAARLAGEHDFHNLNPDDERTVRDVAIELDRADDFLRVTVSSDGFPRQLIRRLVTLLAEAGRGDRSMADVEGVLGPEDLPGHEGIEPAPAHPLVLSAVDYDVAFEVDEAGADAVRGAFEARRIEHAARSRVAGFVGRGV